MRTKLFTLLGSLVILCVAGQVAFGQYGPSYGMRPPSLPGYGGPYAQPAGMPTMISQGGPPMWYGGPAPGVMVVPQAPPVGANNQQPAQPAAAKEGEFRVTLVSGEQEDKSYQTQKSDCDDHCGKGDYCGKDDCCDSKGGKGCMDCCYHLRFFGDYLYLRPRDAEVAYAVEVNSNTPGIPGPALQTSPVGVTNHDFSSGIRAGFGICVDECSEIAVAYTMFESSTTDFITRDPQFNIRQIYPMSIHPGTQDTVSGTVEATGRQDIDFDLIDLEYRRYLVNDCTTEINYVAGFRYGQLQQSFLALYSDDVSQAPYDAKVATDVDFNGAGLRLGLEGERRGFCLPIMLYAKGYASLLAGEFDATYSQTGQNTTSKIVDTGWQAGRIVPTFDLEVGSGFCLPHGHLRVTTGYVFSAWTNMVKNEDWINAVQTNDFRDMNDSMTFDGFVFRIDGRF